MIQKTISINRKAGLYAEPVNTLVQTASRFSAEVFVIHNGRRVNGKSVLGILSLAIPKQAEITLEVVGEDEHEAFHELVQTFEKLN